MTRPPRPRPGLRAARLPFAALLVLLALTLAATAPAPVAAQPAQPAAPGAPAAPAATDAESADALLAQWDDGARRAELVTERAELSTPAFEVLRETVAAQRAAARALVERTETAARPLRTQLAALGPPPAEGASEAESIAAERAALERRLEALDARIRQAELAAARATAIIEDIDTLIRARFAEQLLTLGPTPLNPALWPASVLEVAALGDRLVSEVVFALGDPVRAAERRTQLPLLALAVAAAVALVIVARGPLVRGIAARVGPDANRGRRTAAAAASALARVALPAAALAVAGAALHGSRLTGPVGGVLLDHAIYGLALLIAARGIGWAFFAPDAPALRLANLDDRDAAAAARRAFLLGLVLCLHQIAVRGGEALNLSAGTLAMANAALLAFGAVAMWALSNQVRPRPIAEVVPDEDAPEAPPVGPAATDEAEAGSIGRRMAAVAALAMKASAVAAPLAAVTGYYAASQFLFYPLALSLGVVALGVLVFIMIRDGVDAYLEAHGGKVGDGLRLLPVLVGFLIGALTAPVLALIWGARPADLLDAWAAISGGVDIGGARISPVDFLTFVLVFGVGYTLTRLFQAVLAGSVLSKTKMDSGGRAALTSGFGYIGVGVALIIGVSAAGLDLSSLAIVAGALSVGIGFGLQTIVNNFVSGIILLVERPIKVGDWIEVGGTHGIVKRISVRATEIEGFDRSALIVPNSELVSGRVTNYTHENVLGRVIVSVGVAYGTDVRRVEAILLELARAETRALRYPPPRVFFMGFGADSLNFDVHLVLREVTNRLSVMSDMHFAIDKRFAAEGIEIPFAQRVLHIQNPERLAAAFRRRPSAASATDGDDGGGQDGGREAGPPAVPAPPAGATPSGANIT